MKNTLAAATIAALVGVAGAANAADLYKGSTKDVPAYVPPPLWTGFYIGAHVGGIWADIKNRDLDGFTDAGLARSFNNNNDGVFGGGTVGYNWQAGNWGVGSGAGTVVIGVEADFGGAGLNGSFNDGLLATQFGFLRVKNDGSFYADVTGRLGYAVGPALFYAKGGWAFLNTNFTVDGCCNSVTGLPFSINNNNGLDGWTVGGGIEYMWTSSWSVKAEYLFFDFSRNHNHADFVDATGATLFRFDNELQVNSFKVGLNYHFNNVYTPLK